jgi:hypothetical protein
MNIKIVPSTTMKVSTSAFITSFWQMKGSHLLFIDRSDIASINYIDTKAADLGEIAHV